MSQVKGMKKIIWPIDAFDKSTLSAQRMAKVLEAYTADQEVAIQPVYVMSPANFNIHPAHWAQWENEFRPAAMKELKAKLKKIRLKKILEPRILIEPSPFTRAMTVALAKYAEAESADLIAVATHARSGLRRLVLGSFAETLLLKSKVPLLTANPSVAPPRKIDTIFVPSDLRERALAGFHSIVALAEKIDARIVLYHKYMTLFPGSEKPSPGSYAAYDRENQERHRKAAESWAEYARKRGVDVEVLIDTRMGTLIDAVKRSVGRMRNVMLALVAESGAVQSAVVGSVARKLVRSVRCPIWVTHSKPESKARSRSR